MDNGAEVALFTWRKLEAMFSVKYSRDESEPRWINSDGKEGKVALSKTQTKGSLLSRENAANLAPSPELKSDRTVVAAV